MNRYLFLKADWNGRTRSIGGIDPALLLLLSARYV